MYPEAPVTMTCGIVEQSSRLHTLSATRFPGVPRWVRVQMPCVVPRSSAPKPQGAPARAVAEKRFDDQGRELLDQLVGREDDGAGAVAPWAAESQDDFAAGQDLERAWRNGWPQDVAGQAFEAAQVAGRYEDIGVEVEAGELSVTGAARSRLRAVLVRAGVVGGLVPEALHTPPRAPAGGDATGDRCAADAGEERRVFGERVARLDRHLGLLELDAAPAGEPHHTPANGVDELRHLAVRGRRQGNEPCGAGRVGDEEAVGDKAVEVNIEQ